MTLSSKLFTLFILLVILACKPDTKLQKTLIGKWELEEGERNSQTQESLKGIFIDFGNDSITTNFNATTIAETVPYKLNGDKITQKDNIPIEYTIENQTDSTLQLYTELRGSSFRLYLKKN